MFVLLHHTCSCLAAMRSLLMCQQPGSSRTAGINVTVLHAPCTSIGTKYTVRVHRRASDTFSLSLGSSSVDAVIRTLNDGGLLVQASRLLYPHQKYPKAINALQNFSSMISQLRGLALVQAMRRDAAGTPWDPAHLPTLTSNLLACSVLPTCASGDPHHTCHVTCPDCNTGGRAVACGTQ